MRTHALPRHRLVLMACSLLAIGAMLALPATALAAKASTRIVAAKTTTVDRSTPGTNPWPVTLSAKLQKKVSGTYRAYTGTVKLYRYDPAEGRYVYITSKKSSNPSFEIARRGRYKLYFAGSSTAKSCVAYSSFRENIGLALGEPTIEVVNPSPGVARVSVAYPVSWNAEAFDGLIKVEYMGMFDDSATIEYEAGSYTYSQREIATQRTLTFTYDIEQSEYLDTLDTLGTIYIDPQFDGGYIVEPLPIEKQASWG